MAYALAVTVALALPVSHGSAQGADGTDPLTAQARQAAAAGAVPPIDEAAERPGFFAFRAALLRALAARDTAAVLAAAHPEVRLSFGGHIGREDLRAFLAEDAYWGDLGETLALGGTFPSDTTFYAPWVYTRFPDGLTPNVGYVALGDDVPVHADPTTESATLEQLVWTVAVRDYEAEPGAGLTWGGPWIAVRLVDGRLGFVQAHLVRSPIQYRAGFLYQDGRWWLHVTLSFVHFMAFPDEAAMAAHQRAPYTARFVEAL